MRWAAVFAVVAAVTAAAPVAARPTFRAPPAGGWSPLTVPQTNRLVARYLNRNVPGAWITGCRVGRNRATCTYAYEDAVEVNGVATAVVFEDALVEVRQGRCGRWVYDEYADDQPDFYRCY